ncbi:MAG: hypothetical protein LBD52_02360 [Prevotellaceae bacterium]|jgi:hypothetical protein|nr:hypothetical protein [Prevotellaceae bacterium]
MKKYSVLLIGMLLLSPVVFFSCDINEDDIDYEQMCHDEGKLHCFDSYCCPSDTPWTDGHSSCYNTLSYCRQSGWACSACY